MTRFATYRNSFPNARLTRSRTGVLEVALHTDGDTLVCHGYTHEQFVNLFHAIGSDPENRVVILTGSGDAFMESIALDGFDFFSPRGYDKIYREGKKVLMNILDIEVPLIAAVNGPVRLHSEYILLADIVLATPSTVFQDKPHFEFGIVSGEVRFLYLRADHVGYRHDRRGESGLAKRRHRGREQAFHDAGPVESGDPRADERQSLSLRLLSQYRRGHRRSSGKELNNASLRAFDSR